MKVKDLISERSGESVRNQFVIEHNNNIYFQSYESVVAVVSDCGLFLGADWNYSVITLKWLYVFLREYARKYYDILQNNYGKVCKNTIEKAIKDGYIYSTESLLN
jgi:hypothetical protein